MQKINKLAIKILLGLFTRSKIMELIIIRQKYNYIHKRDIFDKENRDIIISGIPGFWKRKYVLGLKRLGIII